VRKKHTQAQKLVHGGRTRLRLVTGEIKVIAAKATDAITDNVTHSSTAAQQHLLHLHPSDIQYSTSCDVDPRRRRVPCERGRQKRLSGSLGVRSLDPRGCAVATFKVGKAGGSHGAGEGGGCGGKGWMRWRECAEVLCVCVCYGDPRRTWFDETNGRRVPNKRQRGRGRERERERKKERERGRERYGIYIEQEQRACLIWVLSQLT
jgi:hypothetical protein